MKWYSSPVANIPETYAESIAHTREIAQEDSLSLSRAIERNTITLCEHIHDAKRKTECRDMVHAQEALIAKDSQQCMQLSNEDNRHDCQDNIYSAKAQDTLEKSVCLHITKNNLRNYCEKEVDTKSLALALEKNTLSQKFCSSLSPDIANDCQTSLMRTNNTNIYNTALNEKNPALCESLTDETFRTNCHDAVVLQLAMNEKNSDFCSSISDATKRSYCDGAMKVKNEAGKLDEVVSRGDIGACNSFTEKKIQYQCSDMITLAQVRETHNPELCGNLFNTGMQFACVQIANTIQ